MSVIRIYVYVFRVRRSVFWNAESVIIPDKRSLAFNIEFIYVILCYFTFLSVYQHKKMHAINSVKIAKKEKVTRLNEGVYMLSNISITDEIHPFPFDLLNDHFALLF